MTALSFTCEAAALAKALRDVRSVVKKRATMPILDNVLIEATGDGVRITTTDMDLTAIRTLSATVLTAGAITVDADKLTGIAGALETGAQAKLEVIEGGRLRLTSGRAKLHFATIPAEGFPKPAIGEPEAAITVGAQDLLRPINIVRRFATLSILSRPWLCGVFMRPAAGGGRLEFFAADDLSGHAGTCSMAIPDGARAIPPSIMPNSFIAALCSAAADCEDLLLELAGSYVRAHVGPMVIASKLIEGQYPDVGKVAETEQRFRFLVDATDLAGALTRIKLMRTDKDTGLWLDVGTTTLTVSGAATVTGEDGSEQMPCEFDGEPFRIAFRANQLGTALDALKCDTVEFAFTETFGAPVLLRSAASRDATLIVMPFRL